MSNAPLIEDVVSGRLPLAVYRPEVGWSECPPEKAIVLSGSFRPLHRAHRALLNAALDVIGEPLNPCFEISIRNVEKPEIAASDLERRIVQFDQPSDAVIITRVATFVEKARLLPGAAFAIGFDTAIRLFDDRFYASDEKSSDTTLALRELQDLGSRFVVGGRHDADGSFKTVKDLDIPKGFEPLLIAIPEEIFSDPISSTQIRRSQAIEMGDRQ